MKLTKDDIWLSCHGLAPDELFIYLRDLEDMVLKVRTEFSNTWTWCCGCHKYVECDKRVETTVGHRLALTCGSCGTIHKYLD